MDDNIFDVAALKEHPLVACMDHKTPDVYKGRILNDGHHNDSTVDNTFLY